MQISNLWGLLVLGLIPMIILIHSLKPKPKPLRVSNLFLWKKALKDKKGGIRFLKVNINLPLFFQILFIIMAALALINPIWLYESDIKGNVVIVLDSSASMNTRTPNGTRFELAKKKVLQLLNEISDVNKVMIIEANNKPILHQNFTSDFTHLKTAISNLQPTEMPGNLMKSVYFGLSLMNHEQGDQMIVYTDAAGENAQKLGSLSTPIKVEVISGGESNIGITKFNFRPDIELSNQYEMILEIHNFNKRPAICPVNVYLGAQNIFSKTIGLNAEEKKLLIFPFQGMEGIVEASLEINDDFHVDNKAFAVIEAPKKTSILLVGKENYFIEKLLDTKPNIKLEIIPAIDPAVLQSRQKDFDIIILDRTVAPEIKSGNIIAIQSQVANLPFHFDHIETTPIIQDWDRKHPILRHVNLNSLKILESYQIKDDKDVIPIVESDQSGLIFTYQTQKLKVIFFSFDILKSDLPLKVAFPIIVDNMIQWLSPKSISRKNLIFQTGETVPINLTTNTTQFSIRDADETLHTIKSKKTNYLFDGTKKVGIYSIVDGSQQTQFAVNLSDTEASNIHSTYAFDEKDENEKGTDPFEVEFYLWILLILISIIFLILEWYFWFKKLTV
jgi:Ca-activated chloride channel homolog